MSWLYLYFCLRPQHAQQQILKREKASVQQFDEVRVAYGSTNKGSGVVPKSDRPPETWLQLFLSGSNKHNYTYK